MPYRQVFESPERFTVHNGVNVYHRYHDDDVDQGQMEYWFTTSFAEGEGSGFSFDVRALRDGRPADTDDEKRRIIADALDRGLIEVAEDNSGPDAERPPVNACEA